MPATLSFAPQLHNIALACKSLSTSDLGISWNHSGHLSASPLNGATPTPHTATSSGASPFDADATTSASPLITFEASSPLSLHPLAYPCPCPEDWYRLSPYTVGVLAAGVASPWDQFMASFSDDDDTAADTSCLPQEHPAPTATDALAAAPVAKKEPTTFRIVIKGRGKKRSIVQVHPPQCSRLRARTTPLDEFDADALWGAGAAPRFVCELRSKCRHGRYVSLEEFKAGDVVVCDGDKGFDIGEVTACHMLPSQRRCPPPGRGPKTETAPRVYRTVTKDEARHYHGLGRPESAALDFLQTLCSLAREGAVMEASHHDAYWSFIGLMDFVDVELQADHGKMYIFFKADSPIRFKPLAETLYVFYGCRIWLHQMDRDTPRSSPNTSLGSSR